MKCTEEISTLQDIEKQWNMDYMCDFLLIEYRVKKDMCDISDFSFLRNPYLTSQFNVFQVFNYTPAYLKLGTQTPAAGDISCCL